MEVTEHVALQVNMNSEGEDLFLATHSILEIKLPQHLLAIP
jgi:hypothetical protein